MEKHIQHFSHFSEAHFSGVNSLSAPTPAFVHLYSASTLSFSLCLYPSDFVSACDIIVHLTNI